MPRGHTAPSCEDILAHITESPEPVATAVEIAEAFDVSRQLANERLRTLRDRGAVGRKEVGSRAVVYWPVE